MSFNTDKQTLDDLNIIGKPGGDSIYNIFNNTHTRGGADILEQMFLYPMGDAAAINTRSQIIQYFKSIKAQFPFKSELLSSTELYLGMTDDRTRLSHEKNTIGNKFTNLISADGDQKVIYKGISATIDILHDVNDFLYKIKSSASETPYRKDMEEISVLIADPDFEPLIKEKTSSKLSYAKMVDYDAILRFRFRNKIKKLLSYIYQLDVYISVAKIATERNFVFPKALDKELHTVILKGVYHPMVKKAIPNTIHITPESNIVFLTGANMAGKSTFMKSLGIAMYLAHMGFPVAAEKMEFSVRDGIYTTINLPDDLNSGNSHFYAEVLRVKKVARELGIAKNLFIIFDELFRGTNVKDAYEATIAITEAFAEKRNCMFVVSTHIIEAGEVLKERCDNINFTYLPTLMDGNKPIYTYTLESGITADRHGMIIINNEGILEIIKSKKNKTSVS
jgi:DNA mismatch repair ATPase MutS